jgi:hypothetical protein
LTRINKRKDRALPDKKESILNFPMYAEVDGELVRVRLPEKVEQYLFGN